MSLSQSKHLVSSLNESNTRIDSDSIRELTFTQMLEDIISQNKVKKCDVQEFSTLNTLFNSDVSDNEEIWLVQTPNNVGLQSLMNSDLDFESSVSELKCKSNYSKKKKYNVYCMSAPRSKVNLILPCKKNKSFLLNSYPLAGKVILQESPRILKRCAQQGDSRTVVPNYIVKENGTTGEIETKIKEELKDNTGIEQFVKKRRKQK